MAYNYHRKITFALNKPFDVNYIINYCKNHPNEIILVEVQNTRGISSSMIRNLPSNVLIRVAGGNDDERIKNGYFQGDDYFNAVIYTKNETIKILEEIEKIESQIKPNWSRIQKIIFLYDKLKRSIMYDPKYEERASSDIRSLRSLISKKTVCTGYALIFKEFMDRMGIECEFAQGYSHSNGTGGHSWNIIVLDGKKYPIDLTWDNTKFRSGVDTSFDWLGRDIKEFAQCHYPSKREKTQDYEHTLSQIDPQVIRYIYSEIGAKREIKYGTTTYKARRKDGSIFMVSQIDDHIVEGDHYYRYYYSEIDKNGKITDPIILFGESNITSMVNKKRFNEPLPSGYEDAVIGVLFSKENIADSIQRNTRYLGKVKYGDTIVKSYKDIIKPPEKKDLFTYPSKIFRRSDGTTFIAQKMLKKPVNVKGVDIMKYDIFEVVTEDGKPVLKKNSVYSERDFFMDRRQGIADDYLSRSRLDRKYRDAGGYIGFYDTNGIRRYNPDLIDYFETSRKVDIDSVIHKRVNPNEIVVGIPSFKDLQALAQKYELDRINVNGSSRLLIKDIKTGQYVQDKETFDKAYLANIWLASAGVKISYDEFRLGANYAFNDAAEELYNDLCKEMVESCRRKGVIDTVELLKKHPNEGSYKYNQEIIINLFNSRTQTDFVNRFFMQAIERKPILSAEPLYSMNYAGELSNGNSFYGL